MKQIYTLLFGLMAISAAAQQPAWLGTDVGDGIVYTEYQMFDHGVVSSYRVMAQNTVADTSLEWNFITAAGDYSINWRPYNVGEVYSGYNMIIDPSIETASARYNSGFGGQPCSLAGVQAGYYYTFVIENNELADNRMCINETDFDPVAMDTVYHSPELPTATDMVTFTVELDGSMMPSVGEHVFIRYSIDGFATSEFAEITNFSNGVGTVTVPAFAADTTVSYYALSTAVATPDPATIDFFTLYFGNNVNQNYSFTVQAITSIEEKENAISIIAQPGQVKVSGISNQAKIVILDIEGKVVLSDRINGASGVVSTTGLSAGAYFVSVVEGDSRITEKVIIK